MRLSEKEQEVIRSEALKLDPNAKVYLFGSRVHDHLKGGDIDLLVVSETISFAQKIDLLVSLKKNIGEQKIDIRVAKAATTLNDPFLQSVLQDAKLL